MIHTLTLTPTDDAVEIAGTLRGSPIAWYARLTSGMPAETVYYAADETGILIPLAPDSECNHTFGGWPVPSDDAAIRTATADEICEAINTERDRREQLVFPYMGKQVDSDPVSVQRITVASSTAQMALAAGVPFQLDWACADNSLLTLDAMGVLGMMQALGLHGVHLHYYARALKDAVNAADYPMHINIVDGWPE